MSFSRYISTVLIILPLPSECLVAPLTSRLVAQQRGLHAGVAAAERDAFAGLHLSRRQGQEVLPPLHARQREPLCR